jgi:hypothetical protein
MTEILKQGFEKKFVIEGRYLVLLLFTFKAVLKWICCISVTCF